MDGCIAEMHAKIADLVRKHACTYKQKKNQNRRGSRKKKEEEGDRSRSAPSSSQICSLLLSDLLFIWSLIN
jgi:hypothetical protein